MTCLEELQLKTCGGEKVDRDEIRSKYPTLKNLYITESNRNWWADLYLQVISEHNLSSEENYWCGSQVGSQLCEVSPS